MPNRKNSRTEAIRSLKATLLTRQRSLVRVLNNDLNGLAECNISRTSDMLDAAADTVSDAVHTELIRCENEELAAVEEALQRIDEGSYGCCVECDKNIPLSRLRAVPDATECIDCRRRAELSRGSLANLWSRSVFGSMTEAT